MTKGELIAALQADGGNDDQPVEIYIEFAGRNYAYYNISGVTDIPLPDQNLESTVITVSDVVKSGML
jgi:hypothetical protein